MKEKLNSRVAWIDILKCISILCVLIAHLESDTDLLMSFYNPLLLTCFFFASGYVYKNSDNFKQFIYKNESQLTHTLPVTKNDIYDSKFIQSLIFFGIGFCVILLGLFIAYYSKENWEVVKSFVMSLTTGLNINGTLLIIGLLFIVFLEIFNAIQCGFLGMILGYKQNNSKLLLSVCFGFIAYIVSQSLVLLMMFIVALFDEGLMQIFKNTIVMEPSTLKLLVIVTMVIYIVLIFIMNIVSKKVFSKGVDIE